MTHFDSEIPNEIREAREKYIEKRLLQLHGLATESGDHVMKYLFLTNAGGAVSVLAYLGSSQKAFFSAKVALIVFFIGILFVGIYRAYMVHYHERLFRSYNELVNQYYKKSFDWDHLIKSDEDNVGKLIAPYIFGYISFGSFVIACMSGACSLF